MLRAIVTHQGPTMSESCLSPHYVSPSFQTSGACARTGERDGVVPPLQLAMLQSPSQRAPPQPAVAADYWRRSLYHIKGTTELCRKAPVDCRTSERVSRMFGLLWFCVLRYCEIDRVSTVSPNRIHFICLNSIRVLPPLFCVRTFLCTTSVLRGHVWLTVFRS